MKDVFVFPVGLSDTVCGTHFLFVALDGFTGQYDGQKCEEREHDIQCRGEGGRQSARQGETICDVGGVIEDVGHDGDRAERHLQFPIVIFENAKDGDNHANQ